MEQNSIAKMHLLLFTALFLLLANIMYLDYKVLRQEKSDKNSEPEFNVVNVGSPSAQAKIIDSCYPYSCIDLIRQATASAATKEETVIATTTSDAKEYYIPLGSGQTTSNQWQDVNGLQAYIDSSKYGKIKSVTFEVSMRIPTANGRVYAQLFNATDNHPVWFSEVSMEGSASQLLTSSPIALDLGNKLYKVQMKTTLQYQSVLDLARVHIITE